MTHNDNQKDLSLFLLSGCSLVPTCRLVDYEVCALIHAQLAGIATTMLLTQTLNLLPLHSRKASHTDSAALQYGT